MSGALSAWQGESGQAILLYDDNINTLWSLQNSWCGSLYGWSKSFRVEVDANVGECKIRILPDRLETFVRAPDSCLVIGREVGWPIPVVDGYYISLGDKDRYDWAIPFDVGGPIFIPLRPRLAGILLWSFALGPPAYFCVRVLRMHLGSRRRKQGLCSNCGYPLGNKMVKCSECGTVSKQ